MVRLLFGGNECCDLFVLYARFSEELGNEGLRSFDPLGSLSSCVGSFQSLSALEHFLHGANDVACLENAE